MPQTGSMPVRGLEAVWCWCASICASCPADGRRTKFLHKGPLVPAFGAEHLRDFHLGHRFFGLSADLNCTFTASRRPAFFFAWTTTRSDALRSCAVAGDPSFTNCVSGVRKNFSSP